MTDVKKLYGDLHPIFGLEDTRGFGRNFASYLLGHKYIVKHVNSAYTDAMRSSAPMSRKDDSYDAFWPQALVCVARRAVRIIYGMMRPKTEDRIQAV